MTTLREAAQQALEALEKAVVAFGPGLTLQQNAITALKAALAEQAEGGVQFATPLASPTRSRSNPDHNRHRMARDAPPDEALARTRPDAVGGCRRGLGSCH